MEIRFVKNVLNIIHSGMMIKFAGLANNMTQSHVKKELIRLPLVDWDMWN